MDNPLKNRYDIGVIIGRFQVPELSEGHCHIIDNVKNSHKHLLIVIGISPALGTKKNPMGYIPRWQMINSAYPEAVIVPLNDVGSNELWSSNLDTLIRSIFPMGSICLYGGRDSFKNSYKGIYDTFEVGITDAKEGTKIRQEVGKEVCNSPDFRRGLIYQSENQYPKIFPTVDIAVIRKKGKNFEVLMGKRPGKQAWRFPGGFVSPSDENFEDAALRELGEEFGVEVDRSSLKYVGSNRQNDWRYSGPDEKITTALFRVDYLFGAGDSLSDEFTETNWIEIVPPTKNTEITYEIEETHYPIFLKLVEDLLGKKVSEQLKKIKTEEEGDEE